MFFKKQHAYLSNFYPCRVFWKGVGFPTVEHGFVAAKTYDRDKIKYIASLPAKKAGVAKRIGRNLILRPNWKEIRLPVMEDLLNQKFKGYLLDKLLQTDFIIIEDNFWHDNFWGRCNCHKCTNEPWYNNLGKLQMKIRDSYYGL